MSPTLVPRNLATLLLASSHRADVFLTRLARLLSSSKGVSAALCTLYYTLALTHAQLVRILSYRYEQFAAGIASRASEALLPGETVIATIEPPHLRLTELSASVRAAGEAVNDARMFLRLWGLVKIYRRARETYLRPPQDAVVRALVWGKVAMRTGYQVLENGAYLARKGVLGGEKWKAREARWAAWSNRFWLAYIVVEMLRLLRVRQLQFTETHGTESTSDETQAHSVELQRKWTRDSYAAAGWLPVSLHLAQFDEAQDLTDESWIGMYGLVPGVIALQDAWQETA